MINELLKLMETGGPLMWIIFFVAFQVFSLIIWQAIILLKNLRQSYQDYRWMQENEDIFSLNTEKSNSSIALMIKNINKHRLTTKDDASAEMNIHLATIVPKLEGHLGTIATIGSLLPMLGLLGTVLGMINVFEVVAIHGSGKPEAMAEGISQALLTTASGLVFAIPVIFMHHLLSRKLNELLVLVQQAAQLIINKSTVAN